MKIILISLICLQLTACFRFNPTALDYSSVNPSDKEFPVEYAVYTPPGWLSNERLPLIVFLHGSGGSHLSFERHGADEYLDSEISAGRVGRAIIVLPNGDNGFWENWADGTHNYRDWVLQNIVPRVQQDYATLECPEHCHLAGISMGGFGVLRMAYFAKNEFSSVSAISAPIFNREQAEKDKPSLLIRLLIPLKRIFGDEYSDEFVRSNPYNAWVEDSELAKKRLLLLRGASESERIISSNDAFHERLLNAGIAHDYEIFEGGHKWKYWIPKLGRVVNFLLAGNIEQTPRVE